VPTGGILPEGEAAEPARLGRASRVVKVDRIDGARLKGLGEVHEDRAEFAVVLERGLVEEDLLDVERGDQVELDAGVVAEHLEADGVLATNELLLRIDADVEVVEEKIVVGAIAAVLAAQDVGPRRGFRLAGRAAALRRLRRQRMAAAANSAMNVTTTLGHVRMAPTRFRGIIGIISSTSLVSRIVPRPVL